MPEHCEHDTAGNSHSEMLTTAEAADRLCYSSTASFRRAWRRAGLSLYPQIGERRLLVRLADVEKFLGAPVVDR
jgi:hypothetical protein